MYNDPILLAQIKQDEGRSPVVYKDSEGWWTIGDGILVDPRIPGAGLRPEEMDFITINRVGLAAQDVVKLIPPEMFHMMGPVRQRVLINMCYNLGLAKLSKFQRTLNAIRRGDWEGAAVGMEQSLWYKQVGDRSKRLVAMMRTGKDLA